MASSASQTAQAIRRYQRWIRPLLFKLPAEWAHDAALNALAVKYFSKKYFDTSVHIPPTTNPKKVAGLQFPNQVGLAAGLDKNADYLNALGMLGFGFIEVGTVTPKPQVGNPKPRLFRLTDHSALINRMGFNNKGVDHLVQQLQKRRYEGVLGVNIGKNKDTPNEKAVDDYLTCLKKVYPFADYITINLSSPNTKNLRDLQSGKLNLALLKTIRDAADKARSRHGKMVPLFVKLAPDMSQDALQESAENCLESGVDGVIMSNTTISREVVDTPLSSSDQIILNETGGLSGRPLAKKSTAELARLKQHLKGKLPIIGVGGIDSATVAREKLSAGADLLQLYTGLIYQGPELPRHLLNRL